MPLADLIRVNTGVGEAPPGRWARPWVSAGLVAAAAALAYADSFLGGFQFDDLPAIKDNPTIRQLWPPGIALSPPHGGLTVSGRPVLNLSLALNYAVSGLDTWSYHALNLLIHIGVALALLGLVRRTLSRMGSPDPAAAGLAVALIWVVHPLNTESVTYIVQRAESLMALFYILVLYCSVRALDAGPGRGLGWKALGVLACWLGMATKEVMVTAPVVAFLYDRIFVAKGWGEAWRARRGYYLCLAAGWVPLVWFVASTGWDRGGTSGFHVGVSWVGYWRTQGEAMFRYLGLSFWPHPLAVDYGPAPAPVALAYALSLVVLAGFAATVVGCNRGRPWAFLAGSCYLILAPTSVMPGVLQFVAEHRMYLPLAAVVTAAVVGVQAAAARWWAPEARRRRLAGLLILCVACLGTATAFRNLIYEDGLTLWMDTVTKHPLSALAEGNAGVALLEQGRRTEGTAYCLTAVRLDPTKPTAHYNLGLAYEDGKHWDEALAQFEAAVAINPRLVGAAFKAGRMLDRLRRPQEAELYLRQALKITPDFPDAHGSLGVALKLMGRQEEAIAEFERSLALEADQPEVEFDLGVSLEGLGRLEEASTHYQAAVRLKPRYGEAQLNLGVSLAELGRLDAALAPLQAAVRLLPASPQAHENLATVLDQLGRTDEAIGEYREALRLKPDYADAHYNFGNALLRVRDLAAAREEFREALRLRPDFGAAREMLERLAALPDSP
jgi:tetratricopeptide (TPR) repeat protein